MNSTFIAHNLYWILPLMAIDGVLKLIALWRAARKDHIYWFIALFILNSAGVLPLIYLLIYHSEFRHFRRGLRKAY